MLTVVKAHIYTSGAACWRIHSFRYEYSGSISLDRVSFTQLITNASPHRQYHIYRYGETQACGDLLAKYIEFLCRDFEKIPSKKPYNLLLLLPVETSCACPINKYTNELIKRHLIAMQMNV